MSKKIVWLIVILVVAIVVRFGLERVAAGMLAHATVKLEAGLYEEVVQQLDLIDGWFSWTDAGQGSLQLREEMEQRMAAERKLKERERQREDYENAQAAWHAQQPADTGQSGGQGGERGDGVYHGLNRAEPLKKMNKRD
jgi:hypothetical protein